MHSPPSLLSQIGLLEPRNYPNTPYPTEVQYSSSLFSALLRRGYCAKDLGRAHLRLFSFSLSTFSLPLRLSLPSFLSST